MAREDGQERGSGISCPLLGSQEGRHIPAEALCEAIPQEDAGLFEDTLEANRDR